MNVKVGQVWVSKRNSKKARVVTVKQIEHDYAALVEIEGRRRWLTVGVNGIKGYALKTDVVHP